MLKRWTFVVLMLWSGVAWAQTAPSLHEVATQTYQALEPGKASFKERSAKALDMLAKIEARAKGEKDALLRDPNMMRSRSARAKLAYLARVGALAKEATEAIKSAQKTEGERRKAHLARAQERVAGIQAASHQHR